MHIRAHTYWARLLAAVAAVAITLGLFAAMPAVAAQAKADPTTPAQRTLAQQVKTANDTSVPAGCSTPRKGLSNPYGFARCDAMIHVDTDRRIHPDADQPPSNALSPSDIQSAYQLPIGNEGGVVGIVDAYGDSTAESDLAAYRAQYGMPPCTSDNGCFRKVNQDGGTDLPPDDPGGWSLETSLDLDAVSTACPKCQIVLVEGESAGLDTLAKGVDTAVRLGAVAVSNSYGLTDGIAPTAALDAHYDHPGVAVTVSTGDIGNSINWPASIPNVTSVGGTTLTKDGSSRGWSESAWVRGGSGCSVTEPRPDFQRNIDTGCPDNRSTSDISADADPQSGLVVFSTLDGGWIRVGGTSLSSPLVAGMYALAGKPVADTYPVDYLYEDSNRAGDFNDVTTGINSACGTVLCTAGPGWDGPTGLGTPHGLAAFTLGEHGDFKGKVTAGGAPLGGAPVTATDETGGATYSATTAGDGSYSMPVRAGRSYKLSASAFGYATQSTSGNQVVPGATISGSFSLVTVPSRVVTGVIRDNSGHGYPMYAKITIDGYPHGAVYSEPKTGKYKVSLPQNQTYTFRVQAAAMPGYQTQKATVAVATANVQQDFGLSVDKTLCAAPGYAFANLGLTESFDGWTAPKNGWSVTGIGGSGDTWEFNDPDGLENRTGGSGGFAAVEAYTQFGVSLDTTLTSPVVDLSGVAAPEIGFNTDYESGGLGETGTIDLSVDGGQIWSTVWQQTTATVTGRVDVPIPQAAGSATTKVRFHYTAQPDTGLWWETDNVLIGSRSCDPTPGGLVVGMVTDRNTGAGVNNATVTDSAAPTALSTSVATPDDTALGDGFYYLVSPVKGAHQLTATEGNYTPISGSAKVTLNGVTEADWSLTAGRLAVGKTSVAVSEQLGAAKQSTVTYTNTGTASLRVKIGEANGVSTPLVGAAVQQTAAPTKRIPGTFSPAPMAGPNAVKPTVKAAAARDAGAYGAGWSSVADFPTPIVDNEVAQNNGTVYSVDGAGNSALTAHGYSYDPVVGRWNPIADSPAALEAPFGAFANGRLYMIGGWSETGEVTSANYAYDPGKDSWSRMADLPETVSGASATVLNGQVYVVGGCSSSDCVSVSDKVYSYNPVHDTWTKHADYPVGVAFLGCAGVSSSIACAGGVGVSESFTATYTYDPFSDAWTKHADLPYDNWGMSYAGSGGKLLLANGVTASGTVITNQVEQYDPVADVWTALPNSNTASLRGGGACGMYTVGGASGGLSYLTTTQVLSGADQCSGADDVSWLRTGSTTLTLAPGASAQVNVTLDSSAVAQPGSYTARLTATTDTPYPAPTVDVTMTVTPPKSWGAVAGTVTDGTTGKPVADATVTVCTMYSAKTGACGAVTYTERTDAAGHFQTWLDKGYNPLLLTAAKDGYSTRSAVVKVAAGTTLQRDFVLPRGTG